MPRQLPRPWPRCAVHTRCGCSERSLKLKCRQGPGRQRRGPAPGRPREAAGAAGSWGCAPSSRGTSGPTSPARRGPQRQASGPNWPAGSPFVIPGRPSVRWLCQEASLLGGALAATSRLGDLARNRAPADPLPLFPRSRVSKMGRRGRAARSQRGAHTYHPHRPGSRRPAPPSSCPSGAHTGLVRSNCFGPPAAFIWELFLPRGRTASESTGCGKSWGPPRGTYADPAPGSSLSVGGK